MSNGKANLSRRRWPRKFTTLFTSSSSSSRVKLRPVGTRSNDPNIGRIFTGERTRENSPISYCIINHLKRQIDSHLLRLRSTKKEIQRETSRLAISFSPSVSSGNQERRVIREIIVFTVPCRHVSLFGCRLGFLCVYQVGQVSEN